MNKAFRRYTILIECSVGIVAVAYLIYVMRSMLIFGETTPVHDNLANYPGFQFFAENIINGHFPLWNPFSHGGEPFYPIFGHLRLLEPITLLTIYLGHFISNDIVVLFNWNRFILSLMMVFGVYIVFRPFSNHLFTRLSLIPILLYSSFMLGSFRQDIILNQFIWVPFITYFLLHIIYYKNYHWHNWLILAGFIGLNWQSYYFTGIWIFLLFFSFGLLFFRKDLLSELFKTKKIIIKLAATVIIISAMAMPNAALMLEKDNYVFSARMIDFSKGLIPEGSALEYEGGPSSIVNNSINMPYDLIAFTGTFSSIWDFIQIISPDGNEDIRWPGREGWGRPSEAYMYIGLLPWAIALLGLVAGRHDLKSVWLLILLCFGLIMLGPPGVLHRLLYYIYPPMWFVRHTHAFVLFFIFALLYFYILGLNHIFSTWKSSLFPFTNSKQGIFSHLITNNKICKGIAILTFSACIIISVYWMTRLVYPATNYLFIFIFLVFIIGWFLRKDLRKDGLYVSLIVSHIVIVLILTTNTFKFLRYILPVLGLPLILFVIIKTRKNLSGSAKYYATILLCVIFSMALGADMVYSLRKSSKLYGEAKHPGLALGIKTTPQKPFLSQNRLIYPSPAIKNSDYNRGHLSLLYRQPYVFSPINDPDYSGPYVQVKGIFNGLRNISFEDWVANKEGIYLPNQFSYHRDGSGGAIEKYTEHDGVKDGFASVLIKPSLDGNSYIRFQATQVEELRGKYIRLSIWVKSQNRARNAVQVEIQDYIMTAPKGNQAGLMKEVENHAVLKSYKNSGEWEQLLAGKYIDKNATKIVIRCNIKPEATAPVFFDNPVIEIVDVNTNAFEYALRSKRWNSLLLPQKYFELINKDIKPLVLEEMFAVNKPMFQFKKDVVSLKDSEIPALFKYLGNEKSIKLLHEAVIVDSQIEPSFVKPLLTYADIGKTMQAFTVQENFKGIENIFDKKDKGSFTYSVASYDYNSFTMQAAADNPGFLYWADGYDKGWHAYIDGKEVPIYRANINFKAINIPAGNSNISFTYKPFLFMIGLYIFYGAFIISILLVMAVPFVAFLYGLFLKNVKQVQTDIKR